jgi:branched-chain amino acid transport system permease protein
MNYWLHILISFEIYLILALAMNLLAGFTGLLSLGQAATYGIGAYTFGLLTTAQGWGFLPAALAAVVLAMLLSIPVIICSIRLRGLFFALATLAFQAIVFAILYNWVSVTKGPYGISGVPRPSIFGHVLNDLPGMALFVGGLTALVLLFFLWLRRTPLLRLLQGVRDDQLALMGLGRDPSRYKAIAILLASACTGLAGALFASYYSYIDPSSFTLDESILILSIILIGGAGSILGSVAGAAFYVLLPELLRFLQLPDAAAPHVRMMVYAAVLIVVVLYRPNGFFGTYRFTPAAS